MKSLCGIVERPMPHKGSLPRLKLAGGQGNPDIGCRAGSVGVDEGEGIDGRAEARPSERK